MTWLDSNGMIPKTHVLPTNTDYVGDKVLVGTTEVEARVGAERLKNRKYLFIENTSTQMIYYGPTGVTTDVGSKLYPNQFVVLDVGDLIGVYLISDNANAFCIIQEHS